MRQFFDFPSDVNKIRLSRCNARAVCELGGLPASGQLDDARNTMMQANIKGEMSSILCAWVKAIVSNQALD
jgi:hypothetical protein